MRTLRSWNGHNARDSAKVDGHVPMQERVVIVDSRSQGQAAEQPAEVTVRIDADGFASLDQRVQVRARTSPIDRVGEQPATTPDEERANRVLARVVRDRPRGVLDVADKFGPLAAQVLQGSVAVVD